MAESLGSAATGTIARTIAQVTATSATTAIASEIENRGT
jgi:hypothetical protein